MRESTATLYDTDFAIWAHEQAEHLRERRVTKLDLDHLAEELEALGKSDWRALESHLKNLILHCLKWTYQPQERARRGRGWQTSMDNARDAIDQLLRDNHRFHDRMTRLWFGPILAPAIPPRSRPDFPCRPFRKTVTGRSCR
jgi:hypothetical protein